MLASRIRLVIKYIVIIVITCSLDFSKPEYQWDMDILWYHGLYGCWSLWEYVFACRFLCRNWRNCKKMFPFSPNHSSKRLNSKWEMPEKAFLIRIHFFLLHYSYNSNPFVERLPVFKKIPQREICPKVLA